MKKSYILFIILFACINLFPQTYTVRGIVSDASNKKILEGANISLSRQSDTKPRGAITDNHGRFYFDALKPGKYILKITYVGYSDYQKDLQIKDNHIDLNNIYLSPQGVRMGEVEVTADPTQIVLKSDTAEYNAGAFKTNKDALAQDLLAKMPGITVQNGKVQAQGEDVVKVLVDGKEFFGNDPNAALKNLPAEVVEKIQVYDRQSDQSQFTGFDDGNTNKTINIVTRIKNKSGTFGRFSGGYGDDQRYSAGGDINFFNNNRRISIITQLNNTNQQNFSTEDLLGVMSGSGRSFNRPMGGGGGGGRGGSMEGSGGPGGGPGGASISNFLVNQSAGLTQTKAFGLNYSDKLGDKIDVSGSYFFNYTSNDAESSTNRNYFLSSSDAQAYNATNSGLTKNTNNRFNMRFEYQIDSSNSILFNPSFTSQVNKGSSKVYAISTSGADLLNTSYNLFNSNLTALNSSNDLLIRHKFNTVGRTISLMLNGTFTQNTGNNNLNAEDKYYSGTASADTTYQTSDLMKHGFNSSANLVYTEPINSFSLLEFNSRVYYSDNYSDQKAYDALNGNNMLIDSLSNVYKEIYKSQSFGTGYRFKLNSLSFAANVNYNIAELNNNQTFPSSGRIERTFHSVLPSFFLRYFVSRNNNLRLSYSTNNNAPSIDQLQNVLNNSNTTQLSIGNPNLSQDYKHSLTLRYIQTNTDHTNSFFIMLGATAIQNYIGNKTIIADKDTINYNNIILKPGAKLSIPENLDGYVNLHSFVSYGLPVGFLKSNLNFNASVSYSRTPSIINDLANYANSGTYGLGFVLGSNISEKVDFTLSSSSSYNHVINTSTTGTNSNYFTQNSSFNFYWRFWSGFVFQNELNDQYNGNVSETERENTLIWNMSLGIKVLKNDNGEIRFTANDVLNQNVSQQHNVTDTYTEDVKTNVLGRYYMLSFIYNVRVFNY
jgi:hypothetical protein